MKQQQASIKRYLTPMLALALLAGGAPGCSPDLGSLPFYCNKGSPRCPEGYKCTSNYCHREDECPPAIPGCQGLPGADGGLMPDMPVKSDTRGWDVKLPDLNPVALPRGKFCNGLEKTGGAKFVYVLNIGGVTLRALTGACSPCANLPVGESQVTLTEEGQPTPDLTGTSTLERGNEYLFMADLDSSSQTTVTGGALKPEFRCETVDPFN